MEFKASKIAIFLSVAQIDLLVKKQISKSLIDIFFEKLEDSFPHIEIISNHNFQISQNFKIVNENQEVKFLQAVNELLPDSISNEPDFDEVFFVYLTGIYPLLSLELTNELMNRHVRYLAQYSYSENLPKGIVPFFLSREFVSSLPDSIPATAHDFLIKNLNNYDTEIFFQEPDLRQFRLDFSLSELRSLKLTEYFISIGKKIEYKELLTTILNNPNGFRLAPSYIEMEIYRGCDSACTFCPRQFISNEKDGNSLSLDFTQKFLTDLGDTFPYPVTICLGGMGEPLLHPSINEIIPVILNYPHLEELIIETALNSDISEFLHSLKSANISLDKLNIIVNLTTLSESKYKSIYKNQSSPSSIVEKISSITKVLKKSNVHVQMIKMKEVEEEIEEYFSYFEELEINVILQKYNTYSGLMPEKRVSDLTPIKREFCWHLNRDLYINADGTVSICKQDQKNSIGNLNSDSILKIWDKGMKSFANSLYGNHSLTNAPCLTCDEWYTFNA